MVVTEATPMDQIHAEVWSIIPTLCECLALDKDEGPEQILTELFEAKATLHFCLRPDGEREGFIVAKPLSEQVLFLWMGCGFNGHILDFNATTEGVKALALRYGFTELRFQSPRKGWQKLAPTVGFKVKEVLYSMEIGHEGT
jgi:hypothetical protein